MREGSASVVSREERTGADPGGGRCGPGGHPRTGPLFYVCAQGDGITRERTADGFVYRFPSRRRVKDQRILERIRRLAIPPAWEDVWICRDPNGHLQATGRDAKGRKQYLYHQAWRELRDADKFERLASFGHALPEIRRRAEADLSRPGLRKQKVLGLVVLLLDETLLRVGNEEYARQNEAYGLTTLRDRHASVHGKELRLVFQGKGGKARTVGVRNGRLARVVKRSQELPGEILFQYLDEEGNPIPITSGDVNEYLRSIAGGEFSAKDFRTWGGTLSAARELATKGPTPRGKRLVTARLNDALDSAASHLGNTRAIARRSYVHPGIITSFIEGSLTAIWAAAALRAGARSGDDPLGPDEQALLAILDRAEIRAGSS
ncbi:MAG: DNA topoisomerase IB [bacterium]